MLLLVGSHTLLTYLRGHNVCQRRRSVTVTATRNLLSLTRPSTPLDIDILLMPLFPLWLCVIRK